MAVRVTPRGDAALVAAGVVVAATLGAVVSVAGPAFGLVALALPPFVVLLTRLLTKYTVSPQSLVLPTVAMSLVIAQLSVLIGNSAGVRVVTTVGLAGVAVISMARPRRLVVARGTALVVSLFIFILIVSLVRGGISGFQGSRPSAIVNSVQLLSLFGVAYGYARSASSPDDLARLCTAIAIAPAVYVGANLLLLLASNFLPIPMPVQHNTGIDHPSATLSALGINTDRVRLPMAQSINLVGVVAAAGFAAGVVLAAKVGRRRLGLTAAFVCLIGVLMADTRTAIAISILVAALVVALPRGRWAYPMAVVVPLSPFVVVWLVKVLNPLVGSALSVQGRDFSTGSNRFAIWDRALTVAFHPGQFDVFANAERIVFGYGAGGHIASGAAYQYQYLFRSLEFNLMPAHNVAIQVFLDAGVIGVLALAAMAFVGVRGLGGLADAVTGHRSAPVLALFVVLLGGGLTEVVPTYLSPEALTLVLMTLAVVVVNPRTFQSAGAVRRPDVPRVDTSGGESSSPHRVRRLA